MHEDWRNCVALFASGTLWNGLGNKELVVSERLCTDLWAIRHSSVSTNRRFPNVPGERRKSDSKTERRYHCHFRRDGDIAAIQDTVAIVRIMGMDLSILR